MSIFHYTSIGSLAHILHSGKIRFTRLDLLDDLQEIDGIPEHIKTHFYVSCWTDENEENLSLWKMYTDMKGVRIEFSKKFYNEYIIPAGDYGNYGFEKETVCPVSIEDLRTDEYIILNPFWLDDGFYTKVSYNKDFIKLKQANVISQEGKTMIEHIKNLVCYKSLIWKFQNESRFYLYIQPLPNLEKYDGDRLKQMLDIGNEPLMNTRNFIDIEISSKALQNIIVRLHPESSHSKADEILVSSLLEKYTDGGKIENSSLDGIYRSKE